jgi:hypothetical protein
MEMYIATSIVPPQIKCNGVRLPLRNQLLFVVNSNEFITI